MTLPSWSRRSASRRCPTPAVRGRRWPAPAIGAVFPLCLAMCLDVAHDPADAGAAAALMFVGGYLFAALAPFGLGAVRDLTGSFSASLWALFGTALLLRRAPRCPYRDPTEARMSDPPRVLLVRRHRRHERPRPERRDPDHAGADRRRRPSARQRGGRRDRAHPRARARRPAARRPTSGCSRRSLAGIRERCDAIVQPTTGGGVGMTIDERARVVTEMPAGDGDVQLRLVQLRDLQGPPRPEMAPWEVEYLDGHARLRVPQHVRRHRAAGRAVPRGRHQARVRGLRRRPPLQPRATSPSRGCVDFPIHIQFVLGVLGANAATIEQLVHMHRTAISLFGGAFTWSAAGVGYPGRVPPRRRRR